MFIKSVGNETQSAKGKWGIEIRVKSARELPKTMPLVLETLGGRQKVALYGEMGAGKTTFVKAFCQHLGTEGMASSPTFSLVNEYRYRRPDGSPALLRHLDLYRLKTLREALDIGIEDMLFDPGFCFIEWPQVVEPILPEDCAKIEIEILGPTERRICVFGN